MAELIHTRSSRQTEKPAKGDEKPLGELTVAKPPVTPRPVPLSLMKKIGPPLVVVGLAGALVLFWKSGRLFNGGGMFPMMGIAGLMMMMGSRAGGGQKKGEVEKERLDYMRMLDSTRAAAIAGAARQFAAAAKLYPRVETLLLKVGSPRMWERRRGDAEAGRVRVGTGIEEAERKILTVEVGALEDQEPACADALDELIAEQSIVRDIPRPISLFSRPCWTLLGDRALVDASARAMIVQVAFFHGPDDVAIGVIVGDDAADEWDWIKWLPHARAGLSRSVLCRRSPAELVEALAEELHDRGRFGQDGSRSGPGGLRDAAGAAPAAPAGPRHVVIVAVSPGAEWRPLLGDGGGIEAVTVIDLAGDCPLGVPATTLIFGDGMVRRQDTADSGVRTVVDDLATAEGLSRPAAEVFARRMAPWRPGTRAREVLAGKSGDESKGSPDLMELLNVADAGDFDVAQMWQWGRSRRGRLRVPVGRYLDSGRLWYLDLKENEESHGPHIGIGGATGSGKSELLRTFILSLCMTHSTDDVGFVLGDYKGKKTWAGLDRLPHVLAILNNLEGSKDRIDRILQMLQGEINNRQTWLDSVGEAADNAVEYRALRRKRPELNLPSMPALIIAFDELMQAHREAPELLLVFQIVGTVGRSLDIHIVPVSQNFDPSMMRGIDHHLKARVALKMNSPEEYRPILGQFNAPGLPNKKGVGYFVETREGGYPERVHAAYVSKTYVPPAEAAAAEEEAVRRGHFKPTLLSALPNKAAQLVEQNYTLEDRPDIGVQVVDDEGVATPVDPAEDEEFEGEARVTGPTVLGAAASVLASFGAARPRQLWLPELIDPFPVSTAVERYIAEAGEPDANTLVAPCGLVDVPRAPRVDVLAVGLDQNAAVIGGPQSGKSVALASIITAAACLYSPERVQFYCLAARGGELGKLSSLDHVGFVVNSIGDTYGVQRLFSHILHVLSRREAAWAAAGVFSTEDWRRRRFGGQEGSAPDDGYGDIYLVIDSVDVLVNEFDGYVGQLEKIVTRGPSFGIHLILSAQSWNATRMHKLWNSIGYWYELKMTDAGESQMGHRSFSESVPQHIPGRGLVSAAGTKGVARSQSTANVTNLKAIPAPTTLHTMFAEPAVESASGDVLRDFVAHGAINSRWPDARPATELPTLPASVVLEDIVAEAQGELVLGMREVDLSPQVWDRSSSAHVVIMGENQCGKSAALRALGAQLQRRLEDDPDSLRVFVFDLRQELLGAVPSATRYVYSSTQVGAAIAEVTELLAARAIDEELTQEALLQRRASSEGADGPEIFVLIDNFTDFSSGYEDPFEPWGKAAARAAMSGLRIVVTRDADATAMAAMRGLFAGVKAGPHSVVLMSADPGVTNLPGKNRGQKLPPGRGLLVSRTEQMMVQVAAPPEGLG